MDVSSLVNTSYSKVIYEYALKNNKLKEIREQARMVLDILTRDNNMVYEMLRNYNVSKKFRKDFLKDLFKKEIDEYFLLMLCTVVDFNRCSNFITIIKKALSLLSKALNIRYIKVISAFELNENQIKKLSEALKAYYNADHIDLNNIVNPNIIGGLKIISEEDSINTSYISKLIQIKDESIKSLSRYEQKEDK